MAGLLCLKHLIFDDLGGTSAMKLSLQRAASDSESVLGDPNFKKQKFGGF